MNEKSFVTPKMIIISIENDDVIRTSALGKGVWGDLWGDDDNGEDF
ncbi:MAG: hypothetical protein IJ186_04150 [Bacilli bacterium]|nr:hypothetical protein [Bacilli bacterium]